MKSLYPENKCALCGKTYWLERHHIFNGAFRKKSEKYGAVCMLCHWCHNEPPNGVHYNAEEMRKLKADAQRRIENYYNISTNEFIQLFGKNYKEENNE